MENNIVKFSFDLLCDWQETPPTYRIYVNNELFTERTYIWGVHHYLNESLYILEIPGRYSVRVETVGNDDRVFKIRNLTIDDGRAHVLDSRTIEVCNETT